MQQTLIKSIGILTIASVLGIAALGFLSMNHEGGHGVPDCIGTVTGFDCPGSNVTLADAAWHIATVKGFSAATVGVITVLMAMIIMVRYGQVILGLHVPPWMHENRYEARFSELFPSLIRTRAWLALHEARSPHASPPGA